MPASGSIYIGEDHTVQFDKVRDIDGNYLNGGSASYMLKEKYSGTVITSGSLSYVGSSNGRYRAVIDRSITSALNENAFYYLSMIFSDSGFDAERRLELKAAYHGAT